jgi:hypothetical protein
MESLLPKEFLGKWFRLPDEWKRFLDLNDYQSKPIRYLEIGVFCGANLFCVAESFGLHKDSQLHGIDPWIDYEEYPEYKNMQDGIFSIFCKNIENFPNRQKIKTYRDFSHKVLPHLEDNFYDIIYIDGNHEADYVMEDAVMSFRKLKVGGVLIFDDYGWGGPDLTQRGIDAFMLGYRDRLEKIGEDGQGCKQIFLKKLK